MKERIIKIGKLSFSEKVVAVGGIIAFLALLYPLIKLMHYSTPWYDDYGYGVYVKRFLAEERSFGSAMQGALYVTKTWWWCWQGTFSSIFLMALMPAAFGEQYYEIGLIAILLVLVLGSTLLVKVLAKYLLKVSISMQLILMVIVSATMIELIYTARPGLYWYNSAVHYTFMHGCMFLLTAAAIKVLYARKIPSAAVYMIFAGLLSFVCGGSNYATCLQGIIVLVTITGLGFFAKNKKSWWLLFPIVVYGVALYYNLAAPGNAVRGSKFQGYGPVKSILYSFKSAGMNMWKFSGMITIVILLFTAPFLWNAVKKLDFKFKLPGLITLYSFGLYASGFTSSYYAMGNEGLSRTWVVIKFTFQLLLFINEAYWLGWLAKKLEQNGKAAAELKYYWGHFAAFAVGVLLCFHFEINQAGNYSSYGAFYYITSLEAGIHYEEYNARIEAIKNGGPVVEVAPYTIQPWFTCKGELSTDPSAEENMSMADFYGKEAIYVSQE